MNTKTLETPPAGLYGTLATESQVNAYVDAARTRGTNTITRDDEAGTVEVRSKKGTLMFSAIRKGEPGEPWILMKNPTFYPKPQVFGSRVVVVKKHPETREQFAIVNNRQAVPFDICRLAAGRDKWLREIIFQCVECKQPVKAGESECQLCPACYEKAGEENERLDRGE